MLSREFSGSCRRRESCPWPAYFAAVRRHGEKFFVAGFFRCQVNRFAVRRESEAADRAIKFAVRIVGLSDVGPSKTSPVDPG